jgi:hypothetical protein
MSKQTLPTMEAKHKTNINLKATGNKLFNYVIVLLSEAILVALAIQGMLSKIYAQHTLQVAFSFGFVGLLLVARFRSK